MPERPSQNLAALLESASRLTGLLLCYHDYFMLSGLLQTAREHRGITCRACKAEKVRWASCLGFCGVGGEVDRQVRENPAGWIHRCPQGCRQITLPVMSGEALAGTLYAYEAEAGVQAAGMSDADLEDRRQMLVAIAARIHDLVTGTVVEQGFTRKGQIQNFIHASLERPIRLTDLAEALNLSPSRTGHLVSELFGLTFNQVLLQARLHRAALRLSGSEDAISTIAMDLCFYDQSHLTRTFAKHFGRSPQRYRKQSRRTY